MTVWHFDSDSKFGRSEDVDVFFRELNSDSALSGSDLTNDGFVIQSYDKIIYLDLNTIQEADAPFTMTLDISDLSSDIGSNVKPVNYFSFGYHIRGRSCTALTVGRTVNSDKFVLGTITDVGTMKSTEMVDYPTELEVIQNKIYRVTLVIDNSLDDENRIQLYAQTVELDGSTGTPYLVASSQELELRNFSFVDRKVIIGSSAWTNEPEWEGIFDLAHMKIHKSFHFQPNVSAPPIFYPGSRYHPQHHSVTNTTSTLRDGYRILTTGDVVQVQFHSMYRVQAERVSVLSEGLVFTLVSADSTYVVEGDSSTLYTFQTTITDQEPSTALFSYTVDITNFYQKEITFASPMQLTNTDSTYQIYTSPSMVIVRAPPAAGDLVYEIVGVGVDSVTVELLDVVDHYNSNVVGYHKAMGYSFTFKASLELAPGESAEVKDITTATMLIGDSATITGLQTDRFYNITASITNILGQSLDNVTPKTGGKFSSPVETIVDTVPPVIVLHGNPVNSVKDANNNPGIRVQAETYDDTATDRRAFTFYVNAFEEELTLSEEEIYSKIKNSAVSEQSIHQSASTGVNNALLDVHYYTDSENVHQPLKVETTYHIYMMSEDFADNRVKTISYSHIVDNTLSFVSAEFNNAHLTMGTSGDDILVRWTSEYAVSADLYNVTVMSESVVPESTNGVDWTATYSVTSSSPAGLVTFQVTQQRDLSLTTDTTFDHNTTSTIIYIENRMPTLTATVAPDVTKFTMFNPTIDDFTIRSNQSPFNLKMDVYKTSAPYMSVESYDENFSNYAEFKATTGPILSNLEENQDYNIMYSLSNLFVENQDVVLISNVSTTIDSPIVSGSAVESNESGEVLITLDPASYAKDPTSEFNMYAVILQQVVEPANMQALVASLTAINPSPLLPDQTHLFTDYVSTFTDFRDSTGTMTQIVPSETTYTLYLIADDTHAVTPVSMDLNLDFHVGLEASIALTKTGGGNFVRDGDTISLTWSTAFKSVAGNFSVSMMGAVVSAVATDSGVGMTWKAESVFDASTQAAEYKGGDYTFALQYLGVSYTVSTTALFVDLDKPQFDVEVLARNETSLHLGIRNIEDVYTGTEHMFDSFVTVQSDGETAINSVPFTNTIQNIQGYTFVIDGLIANTLYTVTGTVLDPAGNTQTIPATVNSGTVKTRETVLPLITLPSGSFVHLDGETHVRVSGPTAMDVHSDFDVYVGIFQLVEDDPEITGEFLKTMVGTGAVLRFANNPKNVQYEVDTLLNNFVAYTDSVWSSTSRPLAYNTTKRGVIAVIDADDNELVMKTTFEVNAAAVPTWLPVVEVEDDSGLLAVTDASVSFMETPEGEIVGVDSSGSGNMFTVELAPGADASTALSTNSVVNPVSLNMGAIESVVVPVAVDISESFSYGMWINMQADAPSEEPFSLLNAGDEQIVVVDDNTITVSSGLTEVFTAPLPTNEWTNIMVTSTGTEFRLFVNSEEIKTKETVVDAPLQAVGSSLTIGTIPNLLIDDIRIYNEELSTEEVAVSIQSGSKQVQLTFETGDLPEYAITFDDDTLMLNGSMPNVTTTLFKGSKYTLYQNDNTNVNKPVHFVSSSGDFIVTPDIEYFIDNNSVGNDAIDYINRFNTAMFRKIVITPNGLGNTRVYFGANGSGAYDSFFIISMNSPYIVNMANIAATTAVTSTNPSYTTDTPVGKLAVEFDKTASQSISLEGDTFKNMNMNTMTLATWVNVPNTDENMSVVSRNDAFDMGIDSEGMIYMDLKSENTKTLFSVEDVEFTSMQTIRLKNLRLDPPSSTRYYYVFASLEQIREKARVIQTAIDYSSNSLLYKDSTSSSKTIELLDLDMVLQSDESLSTKSVLTAYVYVVGLEKDNSHQLGEENHVKEFKVKRSGVDTLGNFASITSPEQGRPFATVDKLTIASVHPVTSWIVFPLRPSELPSVTYRYTITTVYDNGNVYNLSGLGNRPALEINAGDTLIFDVDLFVHPVIITDANGSAVSNVKNNDIFEGVLEWTPSFPGTYHYGCSSQAQTPSMGNTIVVADKLTGNSASKQAVSLFAQDLITNETLSEGFNAVNSGKNNVYLSTSVLSANQMHTVADLKFESAFTLLERSATQNIQAGENLMMCFVAISNGVYHTSTNFLNFKDLDESMLMQLTERGFSNRYYEFSSDKHLLRLAHYDDTLSSWYRVQIDYLFDFSEIGAVYEYEYCPLWTSSDQYHALMFFDQRDAYVNYNTQHAHGFFAKGNMNKAMFENTEGYPTWHDGTSGNTSTSTSKWPRYQRLTVIQAETTYWTGQVNSKSLNPANTYSDANELFFEFFSDPERTDLVASGTGSQLRTYEHNDSHFHRSNQLYMTIMYNQVDPNGGGLEFGNLVRIR